MPNVGWFATNELLQLLKDPSTDIFHQSVPAGVESNIFCVLDNRDNARDKHVDWIGLCSV